MKGANEYYELFHGKNAQIGRLAAVPSWHSRGATFRLFVLPEGEAAIWNGLGNAPLNKEAVEVYGVVSGHPGWTESYGWIHKGPWQVDFLQIVEQKKKKIQAETAMVKTARDASEEEKMRKTEALLSNY